MTAQTRVFVLTGAGVSAESGLQTFRGSNGLWNNRPVERVASVEGFVEDPALVWAFYSERRAKAKDSKPNAGHFALAQLEARLGDRFMLATQNVDGLHQAAGSARVIEMHGSLWKTRCSRCDRAPFADSEVYSADRLPACSACEQRGEFSLLRPHIVWFGEQLERANLSAIDGFLRGGAGQPLIFLAVGTSGAVYPAAQLVTEAKKWGADTWLLNLEAAANDAAFDHVVHGKSSEVLPALLAL
jgi:NAD-dependent deacetylase